MLFVIAFPNASYSIEESSYIDLGVQIVCPNSRGAGFFIESKVVVTAKHVVDDCKFPKVVNSSLEETRVQSVSLSQNKDLAYLTVDTAIADVVEVADIPELESQVFTVGSPIDGLVLSKGVLKDVFEDLTEKWLVLQIPADHGSSGGPVFASGGLIGLVISKDKRTGDIFAYTGVDMKNDFKYISQKATTGQDYKIPITNSDAQILMPIFVSATITFLLGIGIGVLIAKGRKKISKPRIRIEI